MMKQVKRPTPTGNAGAGLAFTLSGSAPVSEKAKKKTITPPALTPVAIAAPVPAVSGPPTVVLAYCRGPVTTLAIKPLAREVAVLPLPRLVPLKDAFKLASDRLGSYSLAAHDFVQRARTRQLLIVAQVIGRDGSKRVFLLRSKFWRWYKVVWSRPRPEEGQPDVVVGVDRVRDNDVRTVGQWHFFVGRRRLDQCYSTSKPVMGSDEASKDTSSSETRRKPGRKPVYPLWRLEAALFIDQFFKDNKRWPIAGEVAEHFQTKYEWEPNEKHIRELLKFLLP